MTRDQTKRGAARHRQQAPSPVLASCPAGWQLQAEPQGALSRKKCCLSSYSRSGCLGPF